jgi:hypothetical protein
VHGLVSQHLQDGRADIPTLRASPARPTPASVTLTGAVAVGTVLTEGLWLAAGFVSAAFAAAPLPDALERAPILVSHLFSLIERLLTTQSRYIETV